MLPSGLVRDTAVRKRNWVARAYDEHGAALYRYALMIVGDATVAEDTVHEVFVRVLAGAGPRHDIRQAMAYLRQAVRNQCYSYLRTHVREASATETGGALLEPVGPAPQDDRLMLEQALRALPPEQREVVHLKVFEGLTFKQIAALSDIPLNTAASRYRYAIDKLAAHLGLEREKPGRTA